jgi:uncharacterized protein
VDRLWRQKTRLALHLPMSARVSHRFNDAICIERGPLVYSLAVGEQWRQIKGELPHADWEVHPTTPWNYALQLDPAHPQRSIQFLCRPPGDNPFSVEGAPCRATVSGRRLDRWTLAHGAADAPPRGPAKSSAPLEKLTLLPYGCAKLRVTELPVLR